MRRPIWKLIRCLAAVMAFGTVAFLVSRAWMVLGSLGDLTTLLPIPH